MSDMTKEQIEAAREAGIIPAAQAAAMLAKLAPADKEPDARPDRPLIGDEEDLRFIGSFADIFITIGLILAMLGVTAVLRAVLPLGWDRLAIAAVFLGGSLFFARRRASLPTLALAIGYAIALGSAIFHLIDRGAFIPSVIFLAGMALYYALVRLPFSLALLAWGGVALVFGTAFGLGLDLGTPWVLLALLAACAATVLSFALRNDLRDPGREKRFSDNAFWLHSVASPLCVLSLMGLGALLLAPDEAIVSTSFEATLTALEGRASALAVWTFGVIVLAALWALSINRRVFVLSTLVYAVPATAWLVARTALSASLAGSVALLFVGVMIVFLGVGWHPARAAMSRVLPDWAIFPAEINPNH